MDAKRRGPSSVRFELPPELEGLRYHDRAEAGRVLAGSLGGYSGRNDVLVLALPRGGVPVAAEVASELRVPLDVFLVRKLGVPGREELAMGALASGGVRLLNEEVVRTLQISDRVIDQVTQQEKRELERRSSEYRDNRPSPHIEGRTLILVDDGLATGSTMRAAVAALRRQHPAAIVVAVPVASPSTCDELSAEVGELVCPRRPEPFYAVGLWYDNFEQTTDEDVRRLLNEAAQRKS